MKNLKNKILIAITWIAIICVLASVGSVEQGNYVHAAVYFIIAMTWLTPFCIINGRCPQNDNY